MADRILVCAREEGVLGTMPWDLSQLWTDLEIDISVPLTTTPARLDRGHYDALLCCLQAPEDLTPVREIRKNWPDLPIALVPGLSDPLPKVTAALAAGACAVGGPTSWIRSARDALAVMLHLEHVLAIRLAVRENRFLIERAKELTRELTTEKRRLDEFAGRMRRPCPRPRFAPLLVTEDPKEPPLLVRAFEKAEVPAPIAVVRSSGEAISYLSGEGLFPDRARCWPPTMALLDMGLGRSGIEVLTWIRNTYHTPALPVVILSETPSQVDIERAYDSKANSYLVKPRIFEDLVELIRALHFYWTSVHIALLP
jgi:two-component system response regulator